MLPTSSSALVGMRPLPYEASATGMPSEFKAVDDEAVDDEVAVDKLVVDVRATSSASSEANVDDDEPAATTAEAGEWTRAWMAHIRAWMELIADRVISASG